MSGRTPRASAGVRDTPARECGVRREPAMNTFDRDGISFRYPANWRAEVEESADGGWTVTVQSRDTAFAMVSLQPEASDPADLSDQTLAALRAEYKEIDVEHATETVAGKVAIGFDADFLTVDTATLCRVRCLDTFAGPLLVMCQVGEYDRDRNEPALRAIVASIRDEE